MAVLCLLILPLISCIPVDDFGSYWSRTSRDPAIAGKWVRQYQQLDLGGPQSQGQVIEFRKKNDAYLLINHSEQSNRNSMECKTLKIGQYDFLAAGPKKGGLIRYRANREILTLYDDDGSADLDFVRAKHPEAVNLMKNEGEGDYIAVRLLDDRISRILSGIPDTDEYWPTRTEYRKVR